MDQLETEINNLNIDLKKCHKLNELLLKYRLYFNEYLKHCKCEQTVDQSLIRSKTIELEEEFRRLGVNENVVKVELNVGLSDEDIDTRSDFIEDQSSSNEELFLNKTEEIPPKGVTFTNDLFICKQTDCNERFVSKEALESHICQKNRFKEYVCPECEDSFKDLIKLRAHQTLHRRQQTLRLKTTSVPNKRFVCQEIGCSKVFDKKSSLSVHISRVHKSKEPIPENTKWVCDWVGCDHKTTNRQDLNLHIRRKHTLEKPFKCDKCDKSYELEKLLRSHQKVHSNFRYECDFEGCLYKTPHSWELKTHMKNKHLNEERFVCDFEGCDKTYKYEGDLKAHQKQFHLNLKDFQCEWPGCQAKFTRSESLKNHLLRHKNERLFKCDVEDCGKAFNTRKSLNTHKTLHSGTMYKFACEWPGCTRMLSSRTHIKEHIDSFHLRIRAFKCEECHKTFTKRETLTAHKKNVHSVDKEKKEYKCDECLRVFSALRNLENHKKSAHSLEPLYSCEECEEKFRTPHALTMHRAVHSNGRQEYKCCAINCGKSFVNRETLLSHEKIHNKAFACSWPGCGKRFAKNFVLITHLKRHQNIREYKCEVEGCGQSFVTKITLDYHLDKHSNPLPYKCPEEGCDRAFSRKSSLINHLEKVHNNETVHS